jgi:hypothetical protein
MYLAQLRAKLPTMRAVKSPRGSSRCAARLVGFAATSLVVCGLALWQPIADGAAATTCPGRAALTCSERTALYNDAVSWAIGGFGAVDLFRAPRAQRLGNRALAAFWHYEAATGITRYQYNLAIGSPGSDLLFESPVQAARPPAPVIKPTGIVTRSMARAMRQLVSAEQQEAVNLVAMDTALNRAVGAVSRSRSDWSKYLAYVAAGFARRAADAIGTVIPRQRAVTKALVRARLMFGIGPADQKAEARYVSKHGFPQAITQNMLNLGMSSVVLSFAKYGFVHAKPNARTYSMSQYLSSATVIRTEQALASALQGFANRVPAAPQPPD